MTHVDLQQRAIDRRSRPHACFIASILGLVGLWQSALIAQDKPDDESSSKPAAKIKLLDKQLTDLGALPARYNGRLTTWSAAAMTMLFQVSGSVAPIEDLPALEWFIDAISRHQQSENHRVFAVSNTELVKFLNVPVRDANQAGLTQQVSAVAKAAIDFSVPTGWYENGVSRPFDLDRHADTLELGTSVFSLWNGSDSELLINANYFPGKKLDLATTINGWRIRQGQLPLTPDEAQKSRSDHDPQHESLVHQSHRSDRCRR